MSKLEWTKTFETGLEEIDAQHKQLINLANGLIQAMSMGMGRDILEEIFHELRDYTCRHFVDEEVFMERIGYPGLAEQKASHEQLAREVDDFWKRFAEPSGVSPTEVNAFIQRWILKHIAEKDSDMAEYAKAAV